MEKVGSKGQDQKDTYVAGDSEDPIFFGAKKIIDVELKLINKKYKSEKKTEEIAGLALSGGGIRSASFALGIMQALAHKNWLSKIDYLSTVSGGGYIGSSLTWLLSKSWKLKGKKPITFDTSPANFPYVTYPMSGEAYVEKNEIINLETRIKNTPSETVWGKMLQYLRQNAKYLTPGGGINLFSLIAILLRGITLGLITYFGLLVLLFVLFKKLNLFCPVLIPLLTGLKCNLFLVIAISGIALYFVLLPIYSLGTFVFSWVKTGAYNLRRCYEISAGYVLPFILILAVLGSIPLVSTWLTSEAVKSAYFAITGRQVEPSEIYGVSGFISIIIGIISGIAAFIKTSRIKPSKIPIGLFVSVGTAGLLFGMLLLAYQISLRVPNWLLFPCLIPMMIFLTIVVNLNHISVHRYYRDRLMETFMPNVMDIMADPYERSNKTKTKEADEKPLHDMCRGPGGKEDNDIYLGPYHIINTNVVLVSSPKAKFRGRGGDNFILTPEYCGSNATGWRSTKEYMGGSMTLASAMAISGAAVNPDTGCGGEGITRQPFLSILMGMLNLRLGYWVPNPEKCKFLSRLRVPNYLLPGLWPGIVRIGLNEKAPFLQLSDGGHFENLALYELIRRRLGLIIVCDGGEDPKYTFGELANAMEKVRADFGALIMIKNEDLQELIPSKKLDQTKVAKKGFLMADIIYADNSRGRLIYINTTFCEGLSADLYGYKKRHPSFPEEPTSNQFFDEKHFEAYRELGYQIAWHMMWDDIVNNDEIVRHIMPTK